MPRQYSDEIKARLRELAEQDLYMKRPPKADFADKRYGRLVIQRAVGHAKNRRLIVLAHCDCGGAKICTYDSLVNGVKSCGCLEEELKPMLKKQRRFEQLLFKTIKASRTAKPVEEITSMEIDVPAIQAVIAITNLHSEENEDG